MPGFAHFFPSLHHRRQGEASAKETRGRVITWWGWSYDLMQWFANLAFRGKWQALRQMTADLAQLQPGGTVLVLPGYQSFRHWIIVPIS